ncbi:MAG: hypothetical protein HQM14_01260 [SAR324 cluster bacterium]|nr:hypothetical protein [SAR324 cluster bacterium]
MTILLITLALGLIFFAFIAAKQKKDTTSQTNMPAAKALAEMEAEKEKARAEQLAQETENLKMIETNISSLSQRETELKSIITNLEEETKKLREARIAALESEMAQKRLAAISEIEIWSADEKKRMDAQFSKDYQNEINRIQHELNIKMDAELNKIRDVFFEFTDEEKKQAKGDIQRFIMEKISKADLASKN